MTPHTKMLTARLLFVLGVTALVGARITLGMFDDPEGPNLLVVFVVAVMAYVPSYLVYQSDRIIGHRAKFLLALSTQVVAFICLYQLGSVL